MGEVDADGQNSGSAARYRFGAIFPRQADLATSGPVLYDETRAGGEGVATFSPLRFDFARKEPMQYNADNPLIVQGPGAGPEVTA